VIGEYEMIYPWPRRLPTTGLWKLAPGTRKGTGRRIKNTLYALELRLQAAQRIGIENIRKRRIEDINSEKERMQAYYSHKIKSMSCI
jgi:hypothetical protein